MSDNDKIYLSDGSEELDLRPKTRISGKRSRGSSATENHESINSEAAGEPMALNESDEDNDEPDWVRNFSASQAEDEEHGRSLYSAFDDDDDDSIIDLLSDKEDQVKGVENDDNEQSEHATHGGEVKIADSKTKASRHKSSAKAGATVTKARVAPPSMRDSLPLVVAPKLEDSLVLLQGVGEELDLSGDVGAVGRVKIADGALYIDMKGGVFRTHTYACNTLAVVSVADEEARITSVLEEAVTLQCERNLFESDQLIKGYLEDSTNQENQADRIPNGEDHVDAVGPGSHQKLDDSVASSRAGSNRTGNRSVIKKSKTSRGAGANNGRKAILKPRKKS